MRQKAKQGAHAAQAYIGVPPLAIASRRRITFYFFVECLFFFKLIDSNASQA